MFICVNLWLIYAFPELSRSKTFDYPDWVEIGEYLFRSHDVISFGTPLTVDTVREAYLKGIFPWYTDGIPLPWHCPEERAILDFADLRTPRSLEKERRKGDFTFTIDKAFATVMHEAFARLSPPPTRHVDHAGI
ncbi:MAG: hypothetical protein IPK98_17030 [Chloracidobacterium sp.]|nr:hypothetical protein [Chloracidobacterium sp.]